MNNPKIIPKEIEEKVEKMIDNDYLLTKRWNPIYLTWIMVKYGIITSDQWFKWWKMATKNPKEAGDYLVKIIKERSA